MRFASNTSRRSVHPFARTVAASPRTRGARTGSQLVELFGACLMIACFLVMAMFG